MTETILNCPNCGNSMVKEVVGWCQIYSEPIYEDGRCLTGPIRDMCYPGCKEDFAFDEKDRSIFMCPDCGNFFDLSGKMMSWNAAIGEADIQWSLTQYSDELLELLDEYNESKINECLNKGFYLELIVDLHRHLGEQLRFLLIKQIKGKENIPLDNSDERYNEIMPLIKRMEDSLLIRLAFIYQRISKSEKDTLLELNSIRNTFVHAFNKKERKTLLSNKGKIKSMIQNCQKIEKRLGRFVQQYR
ncbi:MAG: hypothetical protein PHT54_04455 [Candidatus Nanoarchaeia archaeon]|nr:hypothetical protein [Candidatus Nanoarchaeia archaeon]